MKFSDEYPMLIILLYSFMIIDLESLPFDEIFMTRILEKMLEICEIFNDFGKIHCSLIAHA